ncbi:hypothetical protein GQ55_1G118500 [Panicum hallii var. hallii]|uniref:Uncharacterized protein n=1 Tax=Panicum hallii var. hallii TaxID=1504633 RepID=A0A2T7F4Q2_9POAL|nr:hypothetical protein GQ55_1G118500 [Panicum hallii var. hallii]
MHALPRPLISLKYLRHCSNLVLCNIWIDPMPTCSSVVAFTSGTWREEHAQAEIYDASKVLLILHLGIDVFPVPFMCASMYYFFRPKLLYVLNYRSFGFSEYMTPSMHLYIHPH